MGQRVVLGLLFAIWPCCFGGHSAGRKLSQTQARQIYLKAQANWLARGGSPPELLRWRMARPFRMLGLGMTPSGYLIYDSRGHVVVQLMRPHCSHAVIDCGKLLYRFKWEQPVRQRIRRVLWYLHRR